MQRDCDIRGDEIPGRSQSARPRVHGVSSLPKMGDTEQRPNARQPTELGLRVARGPSRKPGARAVAALRLTSLRTLDAAIARAKAAGLDEIHPWAGRHERRAPWARTGNRVTSVEANGAAYLKNARRGLPRRGGRGRLTTP